MVNKKNKKRRTIILVVIAVVIIAVIAVAMLGAKSSANTTALIKPYEIVPVSEQDMQLEISGSGAVQAENTTDFYAPVNLKLKEVFVEDGSIINAGDLIATVDAAMVEDQIAAIKDNIAQVNANIASLRTTTTSKWIKAPIAGTVKAINVVDDDSIEAVMNADNALMVISADDSMRVTIIVNDASVFNEGDVVMMNIDEEEVESVISSIDRFNNIVEFVIVDEDYAIGQQVDVMDTDGKLIGTGTMKINVPIYVIGSVGTVADVHVDVDDEVSKNKKLITLEDSILSEDVIDLSAQRDELISDLDELYASFEAAGIGEGYTIYAANSGIVNNLRINDNAAVAKDTLMYSVLDTQPLEMEVAIDELEIAQIEVSQIASVTFEALPGQKFAAEVTYINPIGQSINNVTSYNVTVLLKETDGVLIGMSGTAKIKSELRQGALTIPLESVQIIDDEYYVILGQDAAIKIVADHKITVGVSDGTYIEVIDGLEAGDMVTVPIENQIAQFVGFGGGMQQGPGGQ